MEKLGSSLYEALKKVMRAPAVDRELVKELVRNFQRALLQADVNVKLVLQLSENIEKKALEEQLPPGVSRREHLIKVIYEELTRFVGEKPVPPKIAPNKRNIWMLVGIQGSGRQRQQLSSPDTSRRGDSNPSSFVLTLSDLAPMLSSTNWLSPLMSSFTEKKDERTLSL